MVIHENGEDESAFLDDGDYRTFSTRVGCVGRLALNELFNGGTYVGLAKDWAEQVTALADQLKRYPHHLLQLDINGALWGFRGTVLTKWKRDCKTICGKLDSLRVNYIVSSVCSKDIARITKSAPGNGTLTRFPKQISA